MLANLNQPMELIRISDSYRGGVNEGVMRNVKRSEACRLLLYLAASVFFLIGRATPVLDFADKPMACPEAVNGSAGSRDGVKIAFEAFGEGEPALVFVHGWSCDKSYWRPQLEYFSAKHKVVALDLAGHGDSGMDRREYTIQAFGEDVAAVVNELNLSRVVLIGHSLGGPVIVRAARLLDGRVAGLVGADTFKNMGEVFTPEQADKALAPFKKNFRATTLLVVRNMFPRSADPALVERVSSDMASAPPEVGMSAIRCQAFYDISTDLAGLRVPIRAINSDRYPTNVSDNKQLYADFELIPMPGVGHFVQLEDPARFNRLLEEIIATNNW
jgi:pimeloyl-ACP methyl ester carboxylesterase